MLICGRCEGCGFRSDDEGDCHACRGTGRAHCWTAGCDRPSVEVASGGLDTYCAACVAEDGEWLRQVLKIECGEHPCVVVRS